MIACETGRLKEKTRLKVLKVLIEKGFKENVEEENESKSNTDKRNMESTVNDHERKLWKR